METIVEVNTVDELLNLAVGRRFIWNGIRGHVTEGQHFIFDDLKGLFLVRNANLLKKIRGFRIFRAKILWEDRRIRKQQYINHLDVHARTKSALLNARILETTNPQIILYNTKGTNYYLIVLPRTGRGERVTTQYGTQQKNSGVYKLKAKNDDDAIVEAVKIVVAENYQKVA